MTNPCFLNTFPATKFTKGLSTYVKTDPNHIYLHAYVMCIISTPKTYCKSLSFDCIIDKSDINKTITSQNTYHNIPSPLLGNYTLLPNSSHIPPLTKHSSKLTQQKSRALLILFLASEVLSRSDGSNENVIAACI